MYQPGGAEQSRWLPSGGETDFQLSEILAPLEPVRAKLLVPAGLEIDSGSAYYVVRAKEAAPGVETLCRWILAEARAFERLGERAA